MLSSKDGCVITSFAFEMPWYQGKDFHLPHRCW